MGIGQQEQEGTLLEFRFAFFEDGGRLVYVGLLAPEAISSAMESIWKAALESFILENVQGQTVPLDTLPAKKFTDEDMGRED